jgi:cell division protease FtsH
MAKDPVKFPKTKPGRKPPVRSGGGGDGFGGGPGAGDSNWKGLGLFLGFIALLALLAYFNMHQGPAEEVKTTEQFNTLLTDKKVTTVTFERDPSTNLAYLTGLYIKGKATDGKDQIGAFRVPVDLEFQRDLQKHLADSNYPNVNVKIVTNWWQPFWNFAPFLLIMGFLYFFFRQQLRMAGKSAFSFGKSRARMMSRDKNRITFKDVAGIEEAKDELSEIVEFLRDPRRFQKLGGRIPKGVLMIGPPGTGKTLLAKAIAGEADVPFFSISGSDFVEMFVGVGASRVRDMFEQGKRSAPCLIFIDEIDAVGRSRGTGMGGGHDEREQTLNALLVEMDGIETQEGVIIIAATNRKDVLDPALLRPGRFDREVQVHLPDVRGREQILLVHCRNVKVGRSVDLAVIARGTPGYSGAELANVVNEAALLAARRNKEDVGQAEFEEARDKVRWGRERRSMAMTEEEKKTTAYHEAGHALLQAVLEHADPLHKVSIIPRGPALGMTMSLPEKDKYSAWKKELLDRLCVIMGGRIAEEIFLGDISSGASGDIQQATYFAKKMVCEWGMSDKLGMVQYTDDSNYVFLGRDLGGSRGYSEVTAQEIDREVLAIVNNAYQRAKEIILANRDKMELITLALLEYETLDGKHIVDIIKHGRMLTPPPKPLDPPMNPNPSEPLPVNPVPEKKKDPGGLLPGLQGAPAGA